MLHIGPLNIFWNGQQGLTVTTRRPFLALLWLVCFSVGAFWINLGLETKNKEVTQYSDWSPLNYISGAHEVGILYLETSSHASLACKGCHVECTHIYILCPTACAKGPLIYSQYIIVCNKSNMYPRAFESNWTSFFSPLCHALILRGTECLDAINKKHIYSMCVYIC